MDKHYKKTDLLPKIHVVLQNTPAASLQRVGLGDSNPYKNDIPINQYVNYINKYVSIHSIGIK